MPTNMTSSQPVATAGRREWIGLAVLALPTLLLSIDLSVLYLALPHLSADLDPSATEQLWIMDSYGFLLAGFLITMGTLGDRIGRRRLLLLGAAAFSVASVAAAYSTSAEMLILTRALMGVAGATLMPSTLALISNMFTDAHQRGVAIAVWMSCFMGGMTVGPLVGGVLLESFWWGSVFLLGVPVMALLLVAAPILLPEYRDESAGRLDLVSVSLSLATILPVIYGLKEIAQHGLRGAYLLAVVTGLVLGVVFVRRQLHLADPLIDVTLFRAREFSGALGVNLCAGVVMAGTFLLLSLHLQLVEGFSPLEAGLCLVPMNVAMAVATNLTPHLARRIRPGYLMAGGLVVAAAGLLLVTRVQSSGSLGLLIVGFTLASVGIALPSVLGIGFVMGSVPPAKAGSASGISETSGEFGIAFGVATLGSIAGAVYRAEFTPPSDLPATAAGSADASMVGAVSTTQHLPKDLATEVLTLAGEAFTSGLNLVGGLGAALFLGLAIVSVALFRHMPAVGTEPTETDLDVSPVGDLA